MTTEENEKPSLSELADQLFGTGPAPKKEFSADMREAASALYDMYEMHLAGGFTENQALRLVAYFLAETGRGGVVE